MKVLSLIVPAYNSARFLNKGIGSFLDERILDALDIIIVNDGSSDETESVAERFCGKYPDSVRLISQENRGHGGALNAGCAEAKGKYLKVIDADDWVETQNLADLLECLKSCDSDVVLTHYYTVDISNGEVKSWKCAPEEFGKPYTMEEVLNRWGGFEWSMTLHGITYRTDFYQKKGIQLSEHVFYEDYEYSTFPCCMAQHVTPLDLFIYDYRIGDVEQSVSDANQLKRSGHVETVLKRMIFEYQQITGCDEACKVYICRKIAGLLMSYLTTQMLVNPNKPAGREAAWAMMDYVRKEAPFVWTMAEKKFRVYMLLNRFHVSKNLFESMLRLKMALKSAAKTNNN